MPNPYLPPEILNHIVDLLHGEPNALKQCCLVSKSWVPPTRKHLFASITFDSTKDIELWKKTFPDPSNSPAYYTHTLFMSCPEVITAEECGWVRAFSRVVHLDMGYTGRRFDVSCVSLTSFHELSPSA
jgi:hypothetical protein